MRHWCCWRIGPSPLSMSRTRGLTAAAFGFSVTEAASREARFQRSPNSPIVFGGFLDNIFWYTILYCHLRNLIAITGRFFVISQKDAHVNRHFGGRSLVIILRYRQWKNWRGRARGEGIGPAWSVHNNAAHVAQDMSMNVVYRLYIRTDLTILSYKS